MTELVALVVAALGTYLWRCLGVAFSGRVNIESEFFRWIACVSYAMVAGLVVRIIVLPVGLLAQVPTPLRLLACGVALALMVWPHPRWGGLVPGLLAGSLVIALASLAL
ncbi:MAG: AzlD domain-containing protein [Betaproteobacteria bacterium]|nr:AzlD domain-containing protein [Betaproteobacteria bacterium]NBT75587.1 AzlD domain-containing protein [Betaproteobacteria bacterium]NBY13742.1 AzlD domain-containing protein [Betaproteobacteria bacterium]NCA15608.1 AzlD domain-containing protein [Betaproteobacteria bacterium]